MRGVNFITRTYPLYSRNALSRFILHTKNVPLLNGGTKQLRGNYGFTPTDAREPSNREQVFKNLYSEKVHQKLATPKFAVGEKVRLALKKDKFEKAFIINWSDKVFIIKEIKKTNPPTYLVTDLNGRLHIILHPGITKNSRQPF